MKVATLEKQKYQGELLTVNQWKKKGFQPKEGEQPLTMWANQNCCGSSTPGRHIFDYYYDYQVVRIEEEQNCGTDN